MYITRVPLTSLTISWGVCVCGGVSLLQRYGHRDCLSPLVGPDPHPNPHPRTHARSEPRINSTVVRIPVHPVLVGTDKRCKVCRD